MTFSIEIADEDVLEVFYEAEDARAQCEFPAIRPILEKLRDWSQTEVLRLTGEGIVLRLPAGLEPAEDAL